MNNCGFWLFDFFQNNFSWILRTLDVTKLFPGGPSSGLIGGILKTLLIAPFVLITALLPVAVMVSTLYWMFKCWIGRPFTYHD